MKEERKEIKVLIKEAVDAGAKQSKACEIVGISEKTLHRWSQADNEQDGRLEAKHKPVNKLTEQECEQILDITNSSEYADMPSHKIVPKE